MKDQFARIAFALSLCIVLGDARMYNAFKAYDKVKPGERPPQYSTRNRAHGVLEYLDNGQIRAFRKRYGPDAREDLFDAKVPFGRRDSSGLRGGSREDEMDAPYFSRRLSSQAEHVQGTFASQISGVAAYFGGLLIILSVLTVLFVRNLSKQNSVEVDSKIQTV